MKGEKAKEKIEYYRRYLNNFMPSYKIGEYCRLFKEIVELAEQEAEERARKELTRWHDTKVELPNKHHRVLLKAYKNGSVFMEVGSLQATDCGVRFIFSDCDGCNVIGCREIIE